jgi:hypothetical protein
MKKNMIEHVFVLKVYAESFMEEFGENEGRMHDAQYLDYTLNGIKECLLEEFDNAKDMFNINLVKSTYLKHNDSELV